MIKYTSLRNLAAIYQFLHSNAKEVDSLHHDWRKHVRQAYVKLFTFEGANLRVQESFIDNIYSTISASTAKTSADLENLLLTVTARLALVAWGDPNTYSEYDQQHNSVCRAFSTDIPYCVSSAKEDLQALESALRQTDATPEQIGVQLKREIAAAAGPSTTASKVSADIQIRIEIAEPHVAQLKVSSNSTLNFNAAVEFGDISELASRITNIVATWVESQKEAIEGLERSSAVNKKLDDVLKSLTPKELELFMEKIKALNL